jgi:hypothetical protein
LKFFFGCPPPLVKDLRGDFKWPHPKTAHAGPQVNALENQWLDKRKTPH